MPATIHTPGVLPEGPMSPFRQQLLDVLRTAHVALDTNEIARRVGVPQTRDKLRDLHYHLNRLERAGLIAVKRSGRGRGIRNLYRAVDTTGGGR